MKKSSLLGIALTLLVAAAIGVVSLMVDWLPKPVGGFSKDVDWLFYFIYYVNVFFFLLIGVLMFVFAIVGRQGKSKEDRDRVVHGATHNTLVEVAWTVPPLMITLAMFVWGFRGYMDMVQVPQGGNTYTVDVEAYQWGWQFTHENGGTTSGGNGVVLDIPAGQPVDFRLSSRDVIHSLYLPTQRAKKDAVPGRYNHMWVEVPAEQVVDKDGKPTDHADFPLHCTEYCGQSHSHMNGTLRVWRPEAWSKRFAQLNVWNRDGLSPVEWGKMVHDQTGGCVACHTTDGGSGIGPSWKNIFNQERDGAPVDDAYIYESIYFPSRVIVPGFNDQMSSYAGKLKYGDIRGVIEYMKSITDGYPQDKILAAWPQGYDGKQWLDATGQVAEPPEK